MIQRGDNSANPTGLIVTLYILGDSTYAMRNIIDFLLIDPVQAFWQLGPGCLWRMLFLVAVMLMIYALSMYVDLTLVVSITLSLLIAGFLYRTFTS